MTIITEHGRNQAPALGTGSSNPSSSSAESRRTGPVTSGGELGLAGDFKMNRDCEPRHWPLADPPVNQGGEHTEPDRDPPHQIVVALDVVEPAGAPAA